MLYYQPVWIMSVVLVVYTGLYDVWGRWGYLAYGLIVALPPIVLPIIIVDKADEDRPITQRFWFKANVWIIIITFIGNYFWTHYFYVVLKARYELDHLHQLNNVPVCMYLITHCYFVGYFTVSNILLRKWWLIVNGNLVLWYAAVLLLSWFTAFAETVTIASYPYYHFQDWSKMLTAGTVFYALDFVTSFPFYYQLDEEVGRKKTLQQTVLESLANCMMVTLLLDFWRLFLGPIVGSEPTSVPFVY